MAKALGISEINLVIGEPTADANGKLVVPVIVKGTGTGAVAAAEAQAALGELNKQLTDPTSALQNNAVTTSAPVAAVVECQPNSALPQCAPDQDKTGLIPFIVAASIMTVAVLIGMGVVMHKKTTEAAARAAAAAARTKDVDADLSLEKGLQNSPPKPPPAFTPAAAPTAAANTTFAAPGPATNTTVAAPGPVVNNLFASPLAAAAVAAPQSRPPVSLFQSSVFSTPDAISVPNQPLPMASLAAGT